MNQLGVIILAAGRSTRMGRPKMLLPWNRSTILGHLLATWSTLPVVQCAVVCALDDRLMSQELDRLDFPKDQRILNPEPELEMRHSIRYAVRWDGWNPSLTHWVIVLGDQPHLSVEMLTRLLEQAEAQPRFIWQPRFNGKAGHPVILPKLSFQQLGSDQDTTLKEFLRRHICHSVYGNRRNWSSPGFGYSQRLRHGTKTFMSLQALGLMGRDGA